MTGFVKMAITKSICHISFIAVESC